MGRTTQRRTRGAGTHKKPGLVEKMLADIAHAKRHPEPGVVIEEIVLRI
jgi:hypothetical protein